MIERLKARLTVGGAALVVTLSGSVPWLVGVDRRVVITQDFDGDRPVWFRVCTTDTLGSCLTSEPTQYPAGRKVVELRMRFAPGHRTLAVETCDDRGCSMPVMAEAEVPVQWELP